MYLFIRCPREVNYSVGFIVGWSKNMKIKIYQRLVAFYVHPVQETHSVKYGKVIIVQKCLFYPISKCELYA